MPEGKDAATRDAKARTDLLGQGATGPELVGGRQTHAILVGSPLPHLQNVCCLHAQKQGPLHQHQIVRRFKASRCAHLNEAMLTCHTSSLAPRTW
jgi:hypothetical protein